MGETREELLQKLTTVQIKLSAILNTYQSYIQLEREFRAKKTGIETGGAGNKTKLAITTIAATVVAFILLIAAITGDFENVIFLAIAGAIVFVTKNNKKSKLKIVAIAAIAFVIIGTLVSIVQGMSIGIAIILVVLVALIVGAEWFLITRINSSVAKHNQAAEEYNRAVQEKRNTIYQEYKALLDDMLAFGNGWYPPDYYNAAAINFFVNAVKNFRAKTMGEAVNLFEDSGYKQEMLAYQRQQVQQLNQLVEGQQEIKGQLRYANVINAVSMFQLQGINSGVQQLHRDMGGLQGSVNTLSSKVSKINSKIKR